MSYNVCLLVSGPARKGLIAAVTSFIEKHNGYILEVDEHLNPPARGGGFMRGEIAGEGFDLSREEFGPAFAPLAQQHGDRKSTRLNSSHANISYAVFFLKKKKT